jgi:hypothetical protein
LPCCSGTKDTAYGKLRNVPLYSGGACSRRLFSLSLDDTRRRLTVLPVLVT